MTELKQAIIVDIDGTVATHYDAKGKLFLKVEPNSRENGFFKRNAFAKKIKTFGET